jgi:RND family efflux transporter MFP subunit
VKIALVALVAAAAACKSSEPPAEGGDDEDEKGPVTVTCAPVELGPVSDQITLRGVVGVPPDKNAIVAPAVAGRVLEVKVHEGDRVAAGAALATVDDPALAPAVREAEATVTAAIAAKANADTALARAQRLLDQGIAPRRDVDDALARAASTASDVAAAEARRDVAVRQRDRAHVTAPIAGVVVHVLRRAGELVDGTPATPIVEIADPVALEIKADVPPADLVRLRDGVAAEIRLDAVPDAPLVGKVILVSPAVDATTGLGSVRVAIAPPPESADIALKLGLAGTIAITASRRAAALTVPAAAVRRSTDGGEEVVVCAKGEKDALTAAVRAVKVGARTGDRVELATGVAAGEAVVVQHVVGLDDGTPLELEGAKAKDDKPKDDKDKDDKRKDDKPKDDKDKP